MTIENLPYGSVIEHRKKRYYKCQGLEGDILMSEKSGGTWYFVKDVNWKTFHVLYSPFPIYEN
jgi:hypothetical protein